MENSNDTWGLADGHIIEGCLLFWDFTEFLSHFLQWVKAWLLWEKTLHIVFWFKNVTDVSKLINTALCRFSSSCAFALILCLLLKELVIPRLSLTCGLVSTAIAAFISVNNFFSKLLGFLIRVFRSLIYILILKGVFWLKYCFLHPQIHHPSMDQGFFLNHFISSDNSKACFKLSYFIYRYIFMLDFTLLQKQQFCTK